jgi:hypothetical protein
VRRTKSRCTTKSARDPSDHRGSTILEVGKKVREDKSPTLRWVLIKDGRTCSYLQPLAVAANITQGSDTRLDHVLTTLGNLYRIYSDPNLDAEVQAKVLESLEKRWAAADQDPFIAAVVLNPFLRGRCLSRANPSLTPVGLCNMLKRLHLRVFRTAVDSNFQAAFFNYYNERREFSPEDMAQDTWRDNATEKVSSIIHT